MENPLVSVVISGYRRPEALRRAVTSAQAQTYSPKEIIVVDCSPQDEDRAWLAQGNFADVKLSVMEDRGACAARNLGVKKSGGEFVAVIDDDAYFASEHELTHLVHAFKQRPEASCVVFKVLDTEGRAQLRDWCHPRNFWEFSDVEFETCYIPEGASAFRRDDFLKLGGYYEPYWIGDEGWDLTLRMLGTGRTLIYDPSIRLHHAIANEGRNQGRIYHLKGRNCIWTAFKDYPWHRRYQFLAYKITLTSFLGLSSGNFSSFVRGLFDGTMTLGTVKKTVVPRRGWIRLKQISSRKPDLMARLRKLRQLRMHRAPQ